MDRECAVIKVLVIDDEEVFRDRVTHELQSLESVFGLSWEIDYAESQKGAEEKLSEKQYTLVVLDLGLPFKDGGSTINDMYGKRIAEFIRDKVTDQKPGVLLLSSHAGGHLSFRYKEENLITWPIDKIELNPTVFEDAVNRVLMECAEKYSINSEGRKRITSGVFRLYPEELTLVVKEHHKEIPIGNRINHSSKSKNRPYLFISALYNGQKRALEKKEMINILKKMPELDPKEIKDRKPSDLRFAFHNKVTEKVEKATTGFTLHHVDLLISEECFGLTDGFTIEKISK